MRIEAVAPDPALVGATGARPASAESVGATGGSPAFGGSLADALDQVNQLQFDADAKIEDLAVGRADSIHEAVIALEKANMALQFTIQVTKKAVEAYQEIMRMPV